MVKDTYEKKNTENYFNNSKVNDNFEKMRYLVYIKTILPDRLSNNYQFFVFWPYAGHKAWSWGGEMLR